MKFSLENINDVSRLIDELSSGLTKLTLNENIEGMLVKRHKFPNQTVTRIRHDLDFIPTTYLILSQEGNGLLTMAHELLDGTSDSYPVKGKYEWTKEYVYIQNHSTNNVRATILFMR
ncbi:MAG: hypothetical protein CMG00_06110 [Candidatus Marinimicrobia bacterium]|nr:hypothetical protein [Candidatus Neomarinimicrobiota bacterium]|tara:strand:- start:1372 stop:1722 length:351 start_codon:yes stop_codon:yes gene_type:complete